MHATFQVGPGKQQYHSQFVFNPVSFVKPVLFFWWTQCRHQAGKSTGNKLANGEGKQEFEFMGPWIGPLGIMAGVSLSISL